MYIYIYENTRVRAEEEHRRLGNRSTLCCKATHRHAPKPHTLQLEPQTPNPNPKPKTQTPNPKPSLLNPVTPSNLRKELSRTLPLPLSLTHTLTHTHTTRNNVCKALKKDHPETQARNPQQGVQGLEDPKTQTRNPNPKPGTRSARR